MPLAVLVLSWCVLFVGCSDAGTQGPPKRVRSCGELVGVAPVEPVVLGQDYFGCAVFAPVPCTKPVTEYSSLCGSDCGPAIAAKEDGDAWLVGCETRGPTVGCGGPDYREVICGVDPFENEVYWWAVNECDPFFVYYLDCWESCNEDHEPSGLACLQH
jgi:hypothetical protein